MGLISHLISLSIGVYAGAFAAQNYEMPKLLPPSKIDQKAIEDATGSMKKNLSDGFQIPAVPSLQQLSKQLEDYLEKFSKKTNEDK